MWPWWLRIRRWLRFAAVALLTPVSMVVLYALAGFVLAEVPGEVPQFRDVPEVPARQFRGHHT